MQSVYVQTERLGRGRRGNGTRQNKLTQRRSRNKASDVRDARGNIDW